MRSDAANSDKKSRAANGCYGLPTTPGSHREHPGCLVVDLAAPRNRRKQTPGFDVPVFPDADCGDVGSGEKPDDRERQRESDTQRTADDQRHRQKQA